MARPTVIDVLTVPVDRRGPSALGLAVIGVLFVVPGLMAPIGLLQVVGALWCGAAVVAAVRDIARHRTATEAPV